MISWTCIHQGISTVHSPIAISTRSASVSAALQLPAAHAYGISASVAHVAGILVRLCFVCTACGTQAWHESSPAVDVYIAKWNGKYHGDCRSTAQCSAARRRCHICLRRPRSISQWPMSLRPGLIINLAIPKLDLENRHAWHSIYVAFQAPVLYSSPTVQNTLYQMENNPSSELQKL